MSLRTATDALLAFGLSVLAISGCGRSRPYPIVKCSGRATFRGRPITDMTITMNQGDRGRPSRSSLNAKGEFSMSYSFREKGVQVGENYVNFLGTAPTPPPKHVQEVLDYMRANGPIKITIDEKVDDLKIAIPPRFHGLFFHSNVVFQVVIVCPNRSIYT